MPTLSAVDETLDTGEIMMNEVLADAIAAVARERGDKFNEAFAAAARLVDRYGESGLAERILMEVPTSVPWELVADLLSILEWSTRDNGSAIRKQAEQWLVDAIDLRRVQIALHLDAYPFQEFEQMKSVLERLALAHPQVAARCESLIQGRRTCQRK